jgi:hypothetical protein
LSFFAAPKTASFILSKNRGIGDLELYIDIEKIVNQHISKIDNRYKKNQQHTVFSTVSLIVAPTIRDQSAGQSSLVWHDLMAPVLTFRLSVVQDLIFPNDHSSFHYHFQKQ